MLVQLCSVDSDQPLTDDGSSLSPYRKRRPIPDQSLCNALPWSFETSGVVSGAKTEEHRWEACTKSHHKPTDQRGGHSLAFCQFVSSEVVRVPCNLNEEKVERTMHDRRITGSAEQIVEGFVVRYLSSETEIGDFYIHGSIHQNTEQRETLINGTLNSAKTDFSGFMSRWTTRYEWRWRTPVSTLVMIWRVRFSRTILQLNKRRVVRQTNLKGERLWSNSRTIRRKDRVPWR